MMLLIPMVAVVGCETWFIIRFINADQQRLGWTVGCTIVGESHKGKVNGVGA